MHVRDDGVDEKRDQWQHGYSRNATCANDSAEQVLRHMPYRHV
jgi:hypothetical protein